MSSLNININLESLAEATTHNSFSDITRKQKHSIRHYEKKHGVKFKGDTAEDAHEFIGIVKEMELDIQIQKEHDIT